MEVSGQKELKGMDMKLWNFCEDFDITTCADGFCVECDVFTCNKCFLKHKSRKSCRDHSLVKIGESQHVKAASFDLCQQHKEELVKYYCPSHDQVCCGECIVSYHNGCKMELVREKAADFQKSNNFDNIKTEIKRFISEAQDKESIRCSNRHLISELYDQFVSDVDTFVHDVIEHINIMKNELLNKAKEIMLEDSRRIDDLKKEMDEFLAEMSRQSDQLESKCKQPNKLFVASIAVKTELNKYQRHLDVLKERNTVTRYMFKREQFLENFLNERRAIGTVLEQSDLHQSDAVKISSEKVKQTKEVEKTQTKTLYNQQATGAVRTEDDQCELKQVETSLLRTKQNVETKKQVIKTEKKAKTTNVSPLYKRQLFCKNLDITGDILSNSLDAENGVGIYVDKTRFEIFKTYSYEIEILSMSKIGTIAIGGVPGKYDDSALPGLQACSFGFHSDGRIFRSGNCEGKGTNWKLGDRIGCRITYSDGWFILDFVHNGETVYGTQTWIYGHFAIGLSEKDDKVKVIFEK